MIIAIDGPSGSGKSTLARALGKALELQVLDTGAMYRAVTWLALEHDVDVNDAAALASLAARASISYGQIIIAEGTDITQAIRAPRITSAVSTVAAIPSVREELVQQQREWVRTHGGGIVEGRDIGTVVFPNADLKIFLVADEQLRAQRRSDQDDGAQASGTVEETAAALAQRDAVDSTRSVSPLRPAEDAIHIDSATGTPEELVERICALLTTGAQ